MQALPDAASSAAAMVSGDVQVLTSAAAAAATAGVYAESAARIDGPWERNWRACGRCGVGIGIGIVAAEG